MIESVCTMSWTQPLSYIPYPVFSWGMGSVSFKPYKHKKIAPIFGNFKVR